MGRNLEDGKEGDLGEESGVDRRYGLGLWKV